MKTIQWAKLLTSLAVVVFLSACSSGPKPINVGSDPCDYCKMTIVDKQFGAEIISKKNKAYKFDDLSCAVEFIKEKSISADNIKEIWLINYKAPHNFVLANKAFMFESENVHSPMGGDVAVFEHENDMLPIQKEMEGETVTWDQLLQEP